MVGLLENSVKNPPLATSKPPKIFFEGVIKCSIILKRYLTAQNELGNRKSCVPKNSKTNPWMMKLKVYAPLITMLAFMQLLCNCAFSQVRLNTAQQIQKLIAEKQSRTPAERKISSQLLQAAREATGRPMVEGVQLKPANVNADSTGSVLMDINAIITANLLGRIKALGGKIIYSSEKFHSLRAQVNLSAVKTIAGYAEVKFIKPAAKAHLVGTGSATTKFSNAGMPNGVANGLIPFSLTPPSFKQRAERIKDQLRKYMMMPGIGSVTSEGDHTMGADSARKTYGYQGEGIRIGVLSDSYDAQGSYGETPNASTNVSTGDLPGIGNPLGNTTPVTVLKDYTGNGATDEGRAMLQIVHDIAPKAQLFFATAYSSDAEFADNILALRAAPNNCDIIIDDVIYYDEPAYQDGIIAQAVNTVTANGCMYFSSAGNGGSALKNYASIWEGDFNDKGSPVFAGDTSKIGSIHNFGTLANPEIGDTILPTLSAVYTLKWADPIGRSSNDYDLFIVTPAGDVFYSSTNIQDGTQDPYEEIDLTYYLKLYQGYQLLVFKDSTAKPVTFVINANTDGFGPAFKYTTQGLTYGHSAVANAFSVAAAPAVSAYLNLFTGTNQVEYFSSDGPRHIFFNADSTPVTPGNFMIGTNGGTIRQKPDITAADGVSTSMPGFSPFYGTSAAAPHAGAIAALLKSANPAVTPTQIRNVITSTALDIEAPGYDNNSGYGIVQAFKAMQALNPKPLPALTLGQVTVTDGAFSNHDGSIDPGESGKMVIQLLNKSLANAGFVYAKLATSTPGVTVTQDSVSFGAIAKGGSSTNTSMPFQFTVNTTVPCNSTITFYISVSPDSGRAHSQGYTYTINTGTTITSNITSAIGSAPPKSSAYTFVSGTQTGILNSTFNQSYCGYQQATPGMTDSTGQYKFNAYTFTNHETTDQCVTVTVKSLDNYYILTSAYDTLGFIPSNPRENFFASYGSYSGTMQYSFTALAGKAFTVVITNGSSFAGVAPDYTLNVTYTKCAVPLRCANLSLNASFATGATGKVYQQALSATGGSGAYMFSLSGNLPPGLTFNGTSIIGTPTQAGSFPLTVTATDP